MDEEITQPTAEDVHLLISSAAAFTSAPRERDIDFLESIRSQLENDESRSLSHSQLGWYQSLRAKYGPEAHADQQEWTTTYSEQHHRAARRMAHYYRANPPYFSLLAEKILSSVTASSSQYVLTRREFGKMCEGKYAKKVLAQYTDGPKYNVGDMVQFRVPVRRYANKPALILEANHKPITRAGKGSIFYRVLLTTSATPFDVHEFNIKKLRRPKK